jgi:ubiquinone biosynthesis protein COQ9
VNGLNRSLLQASSSHTVNSNKFHIPSTALFNADKKIENFRANEEAKEAEYNQQPIENKDDQYSQQQQQKQSNEEDEEVIKVKNKILEAALEFVSTNGWSRQSIVMGAEKSGYPSTIHGMFTNGGIELINFYYLKCNKELIEKMREKVGDNSENVGDPKEFVRWALQERLCMIQPFIKTWPQALAIMTLPPNVPKSLANMLTLVDDICYFSGDRSVDVRKIILFINQFIIFKIIYFSLIGMQDA